MGEVILLSLALGLTAGAVLYLLAVFFPRKATCMHEWHAQESYHLGGEVYTHCVCGLCGATLER